MFRDLRPDTVTITLAASRNGFQLTLDGQPVTARFAFTAVVGMRRTIGAPAEQSQGGTTYTFRSWSDGGAATHDITLPASAS